MSKLTDRYVWGVLRAVPEGQREDLEPEIRALVADTIEAKAAGATDTAGAERAALTELGDPEVLASRYTDRVLYLIGPSYFLDYRRLLTLLLSIVVPVVTLAVLFAGFIAETELPRVVADGVWAGIGVGIQLAFAVTLVFALVERYGRGTVKPTAWSPDLLPELPSAARLGAGEAVGSVIASVFIIGVIAWQPPFYVDDTAVPFFDPALGELWFPWFIVVSVLEIAFTLILYAAHRWSWAFAVVNALLGAAFAIPAIWLLQEGRILSPEMVAGIERIGAGESIPVTTAAVTFGIAAVAIWDAVEGFRKAHRSGAAAA